MTPDSQPSPPRVLPQLGPRPRRFDLPKYVGRFFKGVAEIDEQVIPYAESWGRHNEAALAADGPLWVALGDSSSQGIGATDWTGSWVMLVLERLRELTAEPWQVVNLSMSGGRFRDVIDTQLPLLDRHVSSPDMVTCVIGSNDMMWRRSSDPVLKDARDLAARLPTGTVLSHLGGPGDRRRAVNETFTDAATERAYELFNIWHWPSPKNALAADRIHPSDLGYEYMADLAWDKIATLEFD